jgi:hypothetical protein
MEDMFVRIISAGRGNDIDSWMNLLFIVVMAIVWVIGGLIKATKKGQSEVDRLGTKPTGQMPHDGRYPVATTGAGSPYRHPQMKSRSPQTITQPTLTNETPIPQQVSDLPTTTLKIAEPSVFMTPVDSTDAHVPITIASASPDDAGILKEQPEIIQLLDSFQIDNLQTAILFSEIVGKPLSLRSYRDYTLLD